MSLRRAPTGRWEVRWREGGRRYGRTFDVRADAVAFRLEIRRRQQLGGFVTPELDVTLAEFVGEWWELHVVPNLAPHTQVGYARLLTKHLLPELGGTRFRALTPRVLNRWRAEKLRRGVGEPTVRKSLAVLQSSSAWQWRRSAWMPTPSTRSASRRSSRVVPLIRFRRS